MSISSLDTTRDAWMTDALCATTSPELFFPEKGEDATEARTICRTCPVIAECYAWAQEEKPQFGIHAGLSVGQLARLRQKASAA